MPHFFVTKSREANFLLAYRDEDVSPTLRNSLRIPIKGLQFTNGVLRKIIEILESYGAISDSTKVRLPINNDGIYLTAVNMEGKSLPLDDADIYVKQGDIVLFVTDSFGNNIYFNTESFEPSIYPENGKPAFFVISNPYNIINAEGNPKDSAQKQNLRRKAQVLADVKKITVKQAEFELLQQLAEIKNIKDHLDNNPDSSVQLSIDNASKGYILKTGVQQTPISSINKNQNLDFILIDESNAGIMPGADKGKVYITSHELQGQKIEVERPGIPEAGVLDTVIKLLTEPIFKETGKELSYVERRNLVRNYINISPKESIDSDSNVANSHGIILEQDPSDELQYVLLINGTKADLSTEEGKQKAVAQLTDLFNETKEGYSVREDDAKKYNIVIKPNKKEAGPKEYYRDDKGVLRQKVYVYKMNINREALQKGEVLVPRLSVSEDGKITVKIYKNKFRSFLSENNFTVHTPDLAKDNRLRAINPYFSFSLTDLGSETLYPKQEEETQEEQKTNDVLSKADDVISKAKEDLKDPSSEDPFDTLNDIYNQDDSILDKSLEQKNANKDVTTAQIKAAEDWYRNHPISRYVPFSVFFHMVNSKNHNAVATFAVSGITLYKGSDFTDLYHEAFHAFSQLFLTVQEKQSLYNEVRKNEGTFRDYEGKLVRFKKATDKQVEEYLAEAFRDYMLKGQEVKENAPKQNSFFRRLWNILKTIFNNSSINEVVKDPTANPFIKDLFEKLKVGNISEYSPSLSNVQFGSLNQGIRAVQSTQEGRLELNYQESQDFVDTIDDAISEYLDIANAQLNKEEAQRYIELQKLLEGKSKDRAQYLEEFNALKSKNRSYKFSGTITTNPLLLLGAYRYAKSKLTRLLDQKINEYELAQTKTEQYKILNDIELLKFAINNFSEENRLSLTEEESEGLTEKEKALTILKANQPTDGENVKGIISYHMYKTKIFSTEDVLSIEDTQSVEQRSQQREGFDLSGNESSLSDLGEIEIIYMLRMLPDIQQDGTIPKNRFGINQRALFSRTFNRLARALQNSDNFDTMYAKLVAEAKVYRPLEVFLDRMPKRIDGVRLPEEQERLWTLFWKTFNKTRVPLIQATNNILEDDGTLMTIGEAFNADYTVGKNWQSDFYAALPGTNKYIGNDKGGNFLKAEQLIKDFTPKSIMENPFEFYRAIGFNLSDVPEIRRALIDNFRIYNPILFYNRIKELHEAKNPKDRVIIRSFTDFVDVAENKYKQIQVLEAKYSDYYSNFMVTNAEGNTQFEHSLNNKLSIIVNGINNLQDRPGVSAYQQLVNTPYLSHLAIDKNFNTEASLWMQSMFHLDVSVKDPMYGIRRKKLDGSNVTLKLTNLSGILNKESEDEQGEGVSAASADEYTKLILDIHLAFGGVFELMRHADKGTSYSIMVDGPIVGSNRDMRANNLYVPFEHIIEDYHKKTAYDSILPHLVAEMKRMRYMRNFANNPQAGYDFKYVENGKRFVTFLDVLPVPLRTALESIVDDNGINIAKELKSNTVLAGSIEDAFNQYFEKQLTDVRTKFGKAEYLADNVYSEILRKVPAKKLSRAEAKEVMIKYYVYNNFIHNLESLSVVYGDLALYNHAKEEFHKRNAGTGSTGNIYRNDVAMQNHINGLWNTSYAAKHAQELGIEGPFQYNGILNTAVTEDMSINSVYEEDLRKVIGEDADDYLGMTEADAQGYISFDAYRRLRVAEGTWSPEHNALFIAIVEGKNVDYKKVTKLFPVQKLQYYGPIKTDGPATMAFHKFSLFPLIPSVIKNKNLEKLHNRMVKENIDYLTFESGSKVGTITKGFKELEYTHDNKKHKFIAPVYDKIYSDQQNRVLEPALEDMSIAEDHFTKNPVYIEYLKNQLKIHDEAKGTVIFSTQLRKLVEDGLMLNGVPIDYKANINFNDPKAVAERLISWRKEQQKEKISPYYTLLRSYERNLEALTEFKKKQILEEIGWTEGMLNNTEDRNMGSLLDLIQKELKRKDLSDHAINFIKLGPDGKIKDLSLSLQAEEIEKILNALMVKRLINQKVNGEGLIQVASTLFEEYASNQGQRFRELTPEEKKKNVGSSSLPYYIQEFNEKGEPINTKAMKVKIAFSPKFTPLLRGAHLDGKPISTVARLNEMLQNDEWLNTNENRKMVTLVGVRIPVQGLNSMEFMEVYEFLENVAHNIIVLPSEIVTKAGSDFDVDKLSVLMPNIELVANKPELVKQRKTDVPKKELLDERKQYVKDIKAIQDKYDDIFDRRDSKEEFKFSDTEKQYLDKIRKESNDLTKKIEAEYKNWDVYSRKYKSPKVTAQLTQIENNINKLLLEKRIVDENKTATIQTFKSEKVKEILANKEQELKPLYELLAKVERDLQAFNSKGIENDLITNIVDIISLPINFKPLVTPNSVKILQPYAKELNDYASDFNQYQNINNEGRPNMIPILKNGVVKMTEAISGTRALEIPYNLQKHKQNNIGKQVLGIGAVDNTYNTLLNRVGAYLNPYTLPYDEYVRLSEMEKANPRALSKEEKKKLYNFTKQTLLLDHNKMNVGSNEVISLSHTYDANGAIKISDIINQMINGWVDIAKDTWIFNIQGNKEIAPTLLFMVQSGVPIDQAVYFVSNPLIKEYVEKQKLAKSTLGKLLGVAGESPNFSKSHARGLIFEQVFGVQFSHKVARDLRNNYLLERVKNKENFDVSKLQERAKTKNVEDYTELDKQVFLHFLELEKMADAVTEVKQSTNVDTSKDMSMFEAQDRKYLLERLNENGRFPAGIVELFKKESPIGSFFIQDFQINLLGDAFPLRNHPVINDFIANNLSFATIESYFSSNPEFAVKAWKNDFINYIFQSTLKYFNLDTLDGYKGLEIKSFASVKEVNVLKHGAFVKDGILYLDKVSIVNDFVNKNYTNKQYSRDLGLIEFPITGFFKTSNEYASFVIERELLRANRPLESLKDSKKFNDFYKEQAKLLEPKKESEAVKDYEEKIIKLAYEMYLRNTAMLKTFNHDFLFKGVNRNDSFAQQFEMIKKFYPELATKFSIFNVLSLVESRGIYNLKLSHSKLTGDVFNVLNENINHLSDPVKIREIYPDITSSDLQEILDVFSNFDFYAFLQAGLSSGSVFSINKIVDQNRIYQLIEQPVANVMKLLEENSEETSRFLSLYHSDFVSKNSNRFSRLRFKNYNLAGSGITKNFSLYDTKSLKKISTFEESPKGRYYDVETFVDEQQVESYKGLTVKDVSSIKTQTGEIGAANYDRQNNTININREFLREKYEEKAWTNPRKQKDNSFAKPLPVDSFASYEQFEKFVLEHEFQHGITSREQFNNLTENVNRTTTTGEYEDYINQQALQVLSLEEVLPTEVKETTQPSTSVKPTIDLSKEWSGDLKTRPVYTAEGVNTMRTEAAKPNEHFGNPFSEAGYGDTRKVPSIAIAVEAYKDWLLTGYAEWLDENGEAEDFAGKQEQRKWILDQINQGKLDGATLLYAGKSAARGQGMHPTALAEVVEQLRSNRPSTQPTEVKTSLQGKIVNTDTTSKVKRKTYRPGNTISGSVTHVTQNPNILFVYTGALEPNQKLTTLSQKNINDKFMNNAGENTFGLPIVKNYSVNAGKTGSIRDTNEGAVDADVKLAIDQALDNLEVLANSYQSISFPTTGLGLDMLEVVGGKQLAPQTFIYLSQQLHQRFGFINPKYLETMEGTKQILESQPIQDKDVKIIKDDLLRDFIKNCITR